MTSDAGARPVPLSDAVTVPPGVAVISSVLLTGPGAAGSKRTVSEQEFAGASVIWLQRLETMVNTADPTMRAVTGPVVVWPVLVRLKVATGLTVFCSTPWKSNDVRFSIRTPGVIPVPARVAVDVPPAVALTVRVAFLRPGAGGEDRAGRSHAPITGA